jgi:DNA modification methylase
MIKPYYEEPGITIYNADCRDVLPQIEQVNLILTDPPFGKKLSNHSQGKDRRLDTYNICGDESQELGNSVLSFFVGPRIVFASPMMPWNGKWNQWLIWDKGPAVGGGGDFQRYWKFSYELIQVSMLGILLGQRDEAILHYWVGPTDSKLHPAQKPLGLIKYLVGKVEAQTILDPFMGSGTTLRAAKDLGRKAIGIEIEKKYCDIAIERLRQGVLL